MTGFQVLRLILINFKAKLESPIKQVEILVIRGIRIGKFIFLAPAGRKPNNRYIVKLP